MYMDVFALSSLSLSRSIYYLFIPSPLSDDPFLWLSNDPLVILENVEDFVSPVTFISILYF